MRSSCPTRAGRGRIRSSGNGWLEAKADAGLDEPQQVVVDLGVAPAPARQAQPLHARGERGVREVGLPALQPDFGWLTVTSKPAGLQVTVDGKAVGATPLTRHELAPGGYHQGAVVLLLPPDGRVGVEEVDVVRVVEGRERARLRPGLVGLTTRSLGW